jgi:hypothetical protein
MDNKEKWDPPAEFGFRSVIVFFTAWITSFAYDVDLIGGLAAYAVGSYIESKVCS